MKRTRELTCIHYRRSIKRPASPNVQSQDLQSRCPVCGSPLEAVFISEPEDSQTDRLKAGQTIVFRVVRQESGERPDKGSGN